MERDKSKDAEEVVLREALSGGKKVHPVAEAAGGAKKIVPLKPSPMSSTNQSEPKPKPHKK